MSKRNPELASRGYAHLVQENVFGSLNGRILTLIEAIGLPEKQEESLKSLIRQEIYRDTGIYIDSSLNNAICDAYLERRKDQEAVSAITLEEVE